MAFLAQIQVYCFLFSYLVSLACEIAMLIKKSSVVTRWLLLGFASAGFFAHTVYLITRSQVAGLPPLLSSQQDWLLVLAWIGALIYLILLMTHRQLAHGLFILPAILLLVVVAIFASRQATSHLDQLVIRRVAMFHAASLVLGIAAVGGAAMSGLMYLLHHQRLRTRSRWFQSLALPSLEILSKVNRWMVVFSIPCLTTGLATGFVLKYWPRGPDSVDGIAWTDPTIPTTIVVWIAMIVVLVRVLASSQQAGKAVAQLSLLSGGFLLTTVLSLMILSGSGKLTSFHSGTPAQSPDPNDHAPAAADSDGTEVPG